MRRKFWGFILLILLLTACNLGSDATVVVPTADIVGTQVAQTLTKIPTTADKPLTNITVVQLTKVLQSTITLTPALSPTLVATTLVPSQTPSGTPTPTAVPGDPRTALGTPTWKDTFQKATAWGLDSPYDDGHTRVSIAPGKIVLSSKDGNGWHGWRMLTTKVQNFYLEATINTLDCSSTDTYGLIFRSTDSVMANGYWLRFTCDGRYGLESGDINNSVEIIKLKASPLIKSGSNQTNRIGVLAKANKFSFYANGKLLEEITNDTLPNAGVFGYLITGYKTVNFTFESTEIAYWKLP